MIPLGNSGGCQVRLSWVANTSATDRRETFMGTARWRTLCQRQQHTNNTHVISVPHRIANYHLRMSLMFKLIFVGHVYTTTKWLLSTCNYILRYVHMYQGYPGIATILLEVLVPMFALCAAKWSNAFCVWPILHSCIGNQNQSNSKQGIRTCFWCPHNAGLCAISCTYRCPCFDHAVIILVR